MRRHYEGLGLGLAIAKELVELHNGRIWIENKQPQGSKFFVVLPLSQNDH
jgi:signal transduction histidine kinase